MTTRLILCFISIAIIALVTALPAGAAGKGNACAPAPAIDPRAEQMVRHMADYLTGLNEFTVHADTTMELITPSDLSLDSDRAIDVSVQRPNHVRINSLVPDHDRQTFYDGTNVTIYSPRHKLYSVFPARPTIDETVAAARAMGLELPLADLISSDPYSALIKNARHGYYIGQSLVRGVMCNHLAFRRPDMDWQIWIEAGDTPLPRRLVIEDRALPGMPKFMATFTEWDVSPNLSSDTFTFTPPPGVNKAKFVPARGLAGHKPRR